MTTLTTETAYLSLLGDRVRAWRNEHGMTRKALSAACGVSERYLAQLEAGMLLYDAFYRWCRDATEETHNWPTNTGPRT